MSQQQMMLGVAGAADSLYVWGANWDAQLGLGTSGYGTFAKTPKKLGVGKWKFAAASTVSSSTNRSDSAGIKTDNTLWCWGDNYNGQTGQNASNTNPTSTPVQVGTSTWTQVVAGYGSIYAIRSDGGLFTWGGNETGQLGDGSITARSSPVQVGTNSWVMLASHGESSQNHVLAIRSDGGLFAWGHGGNYALGQGADNANKSSPVQIGTSSWSFVATTAQASFAIRIDGGLFSWGSNVYRELGLGDATTRSEPTQIGTSSWSFVGGGSYTAGAIRTDGGLFTWGLNNAGQCAQGDYAPYKSSPVQVGASSWTAVGFGYNHMLALRVDKKLFWSGYDTLGASGSGRGEYLPCSVNGSDVVSVSASKSGTVSSNHVGLIYSDGSLWMGGGNNYGQLGLGDQTFRHYISKVGASSWSMVSCGQRHASQPYGITAAIRSDGGLFTWGNNDSGQLGHGDVTGRSSPVQVGSSSWSFVAVSTGGSNNASASGHILAIDTVGRLFSWGGNNVGQLGDGTLNPRSSPVQVGTSSWTTVSIGLYHNHAIDAVGRLFSWGSGVNGKLGDGGTTAKSSPVLIGSSSWTAVAAGFRIGFGIDAVGRLFGWGTGNDYYQNGNGSDCSSPVQIGTSSWTAVSACWEGGLGLQVGGLLYSWGIPSASGSGSQDQYTQVTKSGTADNESFAFISAGGWTGYGRCNSQLYSWGASDRPILLREDVIPSPVQVGTDTWKAFRTASHQSMALRA